MKSFKNFIMEQKASDVLKNWRHDDAKMYAEKLIKTFTKEISLLDGERT